MAYKNQKKNKKVAAEQREKHSHYKHLRKQNKFELKHPPQKLTAEMCEAILHERGIL